MPNNFTKQETVAFDEVIEKFEDALVLSRIVTKYETDQTAMERGGDLMWRPQPYVAQSFSGSDATANFTDRVQLAVPAAIDTQRHATLTMTATELRDAMQEGTFGKAAAQKLASDINVSIMNVAANQGTLVVKRTAAASGFDDIAQADAIMNEQGIQMFDRYAALSTRDYNAMANNLSQVSRSFGNAKSDKAYEKAFVGPVAGFDTYKLDYANRITAAAGGGTLTINTTTQFYTPVATTATASGGRSNVDNRFQTVTLSSTAGVVAGDCFTIAGVVAAHHITKGSTGALKTFRVISVVNGTTAVISPPIISNQGGSVAEAQYQNVIVTPSATAAIVFLNTAAAAINPFWQKDALEILPGRLAVPSDAGAQVIRATTDNGLELTMQKQFDINTQRTKYRWDIRYGVVNKQPQMSGIILFSQP